MYGRGSHSLADSLSITGKDARKYIRSFLDTYPTLKSWLNKTQEAGLSSGYISTIFGRKRYLDKNDILKAKRQAVNSTIQGSAADILKRAMINVHSLIVKENIDASIVLQIHDVHIFNLFLKLIC